MHNYAVIINIIHVYTCILARVQCIYMTEAPRVLHFSAFIIVCSIVYSVSPVVFPDPSLTPENLSTVLGSMSDEQWLEFGGYANIPGSERVRIGRQYSSEREKKQAVIHSLTSTHPALSWTRVAHALYWTAWYKSDDSCLRALDRLQQLFPIGIHNIHVYTCTCMFIHV